MKYSEDDKKKVFETIIDLISNGKSLRKALAEVKLSSRTFFKWLEEEGEGEERVKQYARACEERAEALLDEMLDIVDDTSKDTSIIAIAEGVEFEKTNHEVIQRSRLKYDARKWLVSKLNPKKYGDKIDIDHTTKGEKIKMDVDLSVIPTDILEKMINNESSNNESTS